MGVLKYIEAKLIDWCNFSCRACIPFSNIAEEGIYDIEEFEKDISRLAEIYENIEVFRLLGGEPLLLNNICEYIRIVRKYFKNSKLSVVTNGTLIGKLNETELKCFRDNQTEIFVSVYPNKLTKEKVMENISYLRKQQVEVSYYEANYFCVNQCYSTRNLSKKELQKIYERCRQVVDCTNIYKGKIYACPKPFSYYHLNKKYGTDFSFEQDGIDIHLSTINAYDIEEYLKNYMEACRLCTINRGFIKWDNDILCISDWENTDQNNMIINSESSEERIDDISKIDIIHISRKDNRYVTNKIRVTVSELKKINKAVIVISNYSVSEFELFKIICRKAGFIIDAIYCDNNAFEEIAEKKGKQIEDLFLKKECYDAQYLILSKSLFEAYKIASKIVRHHN